MIYATYIFCVIIVLFIVSALNFVMIFLLFEQGMPGQKGDRGIKVRMKCSFRPLLDLNLRLRIFKGCYKLPAVLSKF